MPEKNRRRLDTGRNINMADIRNNANRAAIVSKLTAPKLKYSNDKGMEINRDIGGTLLQRIATDMARKSKDAENAFTLFPDLKLARDIFVSSVLAPKDMIETKLLFSLKAMPHGSDVAGVLLAKLQEVMDIRYSLTELLPDILSDTLYTHGSHVTLVIPEASLDSLINGGAGLSAEALLKSYLSNTSAQLKASGGLGILGNAYRQPAAMSAEGYGAVTPYVPNMCCMDTVTNQIVKFNDIEVTDDFTLLQRAGNVAKLTAEAIADKYRTSGVKIPNSLKLHALDQSVLSKPKTDSMYTRVIPRSSSNVRRSVSRPLVLHPPADAVIPVFNKGKRKEHIGYFLLLDEFGGFATAATNPNAAGGYTNGAVYGGDTSMSSYIMERVKGSFEGSSEASMAGTKLQSSELFARIVEDDLANRLKNGAYGTDLTAKADDAVLTLMLARSLANRLTRLLYVPAELVAYFAHEYNANGVGKTVFDDMRNLLSMRAVSLFTSVNAQLRNSVGETVVTVELDEDEADPMTIIDEITHMVTETRSSLFPNGTTDLSDISNWARRAGLRFNFKGPHLPATNVAYENTQPQIAAPNQDLDTELRKRTIEAMLVLPETVDAALSPELATTAIFGNQITAKRVTNVQKLLSAYITKITKMIMLSDVVLRAELLDLIKERLQNQPVNPKTPVDEPINLETILDEYADLLVIELPKPESSTLTAMMVEINEHDEALDKILDYYVGAEVLNAYAVGDDLSGQVDYLKGVIKTTLMRKVVAELNVYPEIMDMTTATVDGDNKLDLSSTNAVYMGSILRNLLPLFANDNNMRIAIQSTLDKFAINTSGGNSSTDTTESPTDEDDGGADDTPVDGESDDDTLTGDVRPDTGDQSGESDGTEPDDDTGKDI